MEQEIKKFFDKTLVPALENMTKEELLKLDWFTIEVPDNNVRSGMRDDNTVR